MSSRNQTVGRVAQLGGLAIVYGLQVRAEFHERDRWRRFQEAMRAGGRNQPLPKKED